MPLPFLLFVADSARAIEPLVAELRASGLAFRSEHATESICPAVVKQAAPDVTILACPRPDPSIVRTLGAVASAKTAPPFIICATAMDETEARECLLLGAWDCLVASERLRFFASVQSALRYQQDRLEGAQRELEANARFRTLADLAPFFVWEWDEHFCIGSANKKWLAEIENRTDASLNWLDLVHPEDRELCHRGLAGDNVASSVFARDVRVRGIDGRYRVIACRAIRTGQPTDRVPQGGLSCGIDLGELMQSPAPWPGLPPTIRHDINNQLAIIRMMADVLVLTPNPPDACGVKAREIVAASEQATQIVRRIAHPGPVVS